MAIHGQYTDYDLVKIYDLIVSKDRIGIANRYPQLVDYFDQLYHVLNYEFKRYISNYDCHSEIVEWVSGMISFINITNNKELNIDCNVIDVIGRPSCFNFSDYVYRYICLFHPDDMVNHNINIYVSQMYNVLRYMLNTDNVIDNKIMNNSFSNNPTLMKLLRVLKYIRYNHRDIFKNDYYRYIMMLIVSYCYYKESDYNLLYNYLNNPSSYVDKLVFNGYIKIIDKNFFQWYKDKKEQVFLNAEELFQDNKKIIK